MKRHPQNTGKIYETELRFYIPVALEERAGEIDA